MSDQSGYGLLLAFDRNDEQFALGFEMGRVWALLGAHEDAEVIETVHNANLEMVLRMADRLDRSVSAEPQGDGHMLVRFAIADAQHRHSIVWGN